MAEKEEVKLLGIWASPFSRRIEMALKLKGIPYDYVEEILEHKSPLLLALNPIHKKVPVLVHNGKTILESQVILEYIDETWKQNPILPQDPYERSKARFLGKLVDEQVRIYIYIYIYVYVFLLIVFDLYLYCRSSLRVLYQWQEQTRKEERLWPSRQEN